MAYYAYLCATLCAYYFSVIKPLRLQRYNFFLTYASKSSYFAIFAIQNSTK